MEKSPYTFTLEKYFEYEDRVQVNIITEGSFTLSTMLSEDKKTVEYNFISTQFKQKGVQDPVIFSPFKWIYTPTDNKVNIKSKSNLEAYWKRYRDKYNRKENQAHFLVFERLFFNTPMGLENYSLSNSFYLPFYVNVPANLQKDDIFHGLDFLLMPMNIPLNTHYKCVNIGNNKIEFEGWVTLDKEQLDKYLSLKKFQEKAKEYHYSQDFTIDSKIHINIKQKDFSLVSANFHLEIKGQELIEKFDYRIKGNKFDMFDFDDPNPNAHYIVGKPRIIDPH